MMMYFSMNLQAIFTGVISKYIQNSSLKVFEEVSVFFLVSFLFFRKKSSTLTANNKERGLLSLEG